MAHEQSVGVRESPDRGENRVRKVETKADEMDVQKLRIMVIIIDNLLCPTTF